MGFTWFGIGKGRQLVQAAKDGDVEQVAMLLRKRANPNAKKAGMTALFYAASSGRVPIAMMLVEAGVDVNKSTSLGEYPIYIAAANGHAEVVQILVTAKANVNKVKKDGDSALYIAAANGHTRIVEMLVAAKADVNKTNKTGDLPIKMAAQGGFIDIVRILIGAKADMNKCDEFGFSTIYVAASHGEDEIVQLLIDAGADMDPSKFMRRLKRHRGVLTWIGNDQAPALLMKCTLRAHWDSAQVGFDDFSFNIFTCPFDQMRHLCPFESSVCLRPFSVPPDVGLAFVTRVQDGYLDNPYHSWWHGVDVFQRCFALLSRSSLLSLLQPMHVFALLLSALTHDVGHPGTDNGFESATLSPLAVRYNDTSVLEQHHAAETFRILGDPDCNITVGLCRIAFQSLRKFVIDAILQTDMKAHFDLVHALEDAVCICFLELSQWVILSLCSTTASSSTCRPSTSMMRCTSRTFSEASCMRPTLARRCTRSMSRRLVEEFALLAAKERSAGIPVAVFRACLETDKDIATLQLNFINYIVTPLWTLLMELFPAAKVLKANLDCNRMCFQHDVADTDVHDKGHRRSLCVTPTLSLVPTTRLAKRSATTHFTEQACHVITETLIQPTTSDYKRN
ncbi:hypothetical protein SPRG_20403 [Saprolegnia parasitica CBS 223.65]|uniref:Phosphodiesterase n=1 Tax=Saprolegnia parasitica (strain CBS 223.65) TaxID=695850 RepID=A0A067C9P2_SAPPC|nr:hypothetical protein SPRG_20403 [Saprolegnia parasitica CBS 223.65]KDO27178.1 hypothetical protein SPRG_20403 [Saprolegnia parasitica CBS 223.65]|eukprot:XP_012202112.1 hypothetical protein SPRG_20403 [Saprolegnia parasitica CBS 223.65]